MSDKTWRIELGDAHWARYTYARPEGSPFRLLGSVARNAQVGALAETPEGLFVQVNGDHVTPLASGQLRKALDAARRSAPRGVAHPPPRPAAPPVVIIKRRRVVPEGAQARATR